MKKRVLLAFSGGNDSCAAALRLREQGYAVTLLTLDLAGSQEVVQLARQAARTLGAELIVKDVRDTFRSRIIDYFTDSYLRGETPAPCTRCNPQIKWKTLYETATENGFDRIATGHYFRLKRLNGQSYVCRAADPAKDQSYYLWGVPPHYLEIALTPMGDCMKTEVRSALPVALRSDESMGVCFLQGKSCRDFLAGQAPHCVRKGEVVDRTGRVIGTHDGCAFYTVGQKRGLRIPYPYAVAAIDAARNRLVAGTAAELLHRGLLLRDCHIPDMQRLCDSRSVSVRVRGIGRNPEGFARIRPEGDRILVELDRPAWAAAPGQPVVFYEADTVLGGGILDEAR